MNRRSGAILFLIVSMGVGCDDSLDVETADESDRVEQAGPEGMRDAGVAASRDSGSGGDAEVVAQDAGTGTDADAEGCDALTYEAFGKAFLQDYCTACHTGPRASDGIDLSTLAGVKKNKSEIVAHAVRTPRSKPMPPKTSPQPTAEERAKLGEWLDCGPN